MSALIMDTALAVLAECGQPMTTRAVTNAIHGRHAITEIYRHLRALENEGEVTRLPRHPRFRDVEWQVAQ